MPELPDLEVIKEVLQRRLEGRRVAGVEEVRPLVLRVLPEGGEPAPLLVGREVHTVSRRAKFLLLRLGPNAAPLWVAINAMLAGRLHLGAGDERVRTRDYVRLVFDDGTQLRYHDPKGMGKVYITADLAQVPGLTEVGPDALDEALTLEAFCRGLRQHRGEIKGVLTRGRVVAGIGNAYADEILHRAGIYPFRRRSTISAEEERALYRAMREVLSEAVAALRARVGERIHVEVRDMLAVHNRKGQPCPRCGHPISEVRVAQRATNFCRRCQPGTLVRN